MIHHSLLLASSFISFLENRRRALQALDPPKARGQLNNKATHGKDKRKSKICHNTNTVISTSSTSCKKCKGRHSLYECKQFLSSTLKERKSLMTKLKLCFNCLPEGHTVQACIRPGQCKKCKKPHHALLHQEISQHSDPREKEEAVEVPIPIGYTGFLKGRCRQNVLLATELINVVDANNSRAFLDGGS
jgi:hypothetical protein